MNYPLGNFLTQIKNGYMAGKRNVSFQYSKAILAMGKILEEEGYVKKISVVEEDNKKSVRIDLLYKDRKPALHETKIISKPSAHIYVTNSRIPWTRGGFGITIISTSKGIMTGRKARKEGLGGKLICQVS